jgi:YidC/Oxa1 family membrane protein insertase
MLLPFLTMFQIPVLMTWFFSLRYVTSLPEQFPGITSQGFLWFKDLADYDPYGILPIISSTLTFWNISLNPNMSAG